MQILSAILFVILSLVGVSARGEQQYIAECKTKNIWDAGFILHFSLNSYRASQPPRIEAEVFKLIPLWRRALAFSGNLLQTGPGETDGCVFSLADNPESPSVRIDFQVDRPNPSIKLTLLDKTPQEKYGEMECDPKLVDLLTKYCQTP